MLYRAYIGHLPDHYAARWVADGEMRPLLEDKISYVDWFHLAYRTNERNRTALAFIDHLAGRARPNDAAAGRATKPSPAPRPRTISRSIRT